MKIYNETTSKISKQERPVYLLGVGGGAGNILKAVRKIDLPKLLLVALNSDLESLEKTHADLKFQLGPNSCRGLGSRGDLKIGAQAFRESIELVNTFKGKNTLYCVIACLGGGTGSGAGPLLAQTLRQRELSVTAILTMPFNFEGKKRMAQAEESLIKFQSIVDFPIVIRNQDLLSIMEKNTTIMQAFNLCDIACEYVVEEILSMITKEPLQSININQRVRLFEMVRDILPSALADIERQLSIRGNLLHYQPSTRILVPDNNPQLLKAISLDLSLVRIISPRKFEELICLLYKLAGYKVELTQQSRDRGADLLVYSPSPIFGREFLTVVQLKKYDGRRKVGEREIRDLYGTQFIFNAQKAQCITTIGYTKPAQQTAKELGIDLSLFYELVRLMGNEFRPR